MKPPAPVILSVFAALLLTPIPAAFAQPIHIRSDLAADLRGFRLDTLDYHPATATPTPTTAVSNGTATSTPRAVHIDIGMVITRPFGTACVPVTIRSAGLSTAATSNNLTYSSIYFDLDPRDCVLDIGLGKTLIIEVVEETETMTTIRAVVQPGASAEPIPDGALYTCSFRAGGGTPPGAFLLENDAPVAFAPDGTPHNPVTGDDGTILVSFEGPSCPTRTPTPGFCTGDCDVDGTVRIDELVRGLGLVLGSRIDDCSAFEVEDGEQPTVDRLLAAIDNALNGCSPPAFAAPALR